MVYTRRSVWPLVIGIIMVGYAYLVQSGQMEPVIKFLNTGRYVGEMLTLGYAFGGVAIVAGLWHLARRLRERDTRTTTSPPSPASCSSCWWPSSSSGAWIR